VPAARVSTALTTLSAADAAAMAVPAVTSRAPTS